MKTGFLSIALASLCLVCSCSSGNGEEEETGKHLSRKEMQDKMSHIGTGLPYIPEGQTKPVAKETHTGKTVTTVTFDPAVPGQEASTTVTQTVVPVAEATKPQPQAQTQPQPQAQPADQFAIVCGSFKDKAGAQAVVNAAKAKGYDGFAKDNGKGVVTAYICPGTSEEAKEAFKKVSKESFCPKDAWVGKVK